MVGHATATLFEHRVVTFYSLCDLNIGSLLSIPVFTCISRVLRKTYVLSSLFEHRVVTCSSLCDLNIGSLLSIRVFTFSSRCP